MRPLDRRVRDHLAPARGPLVVVVAAGVLGGLLTVVQALALGSLVVTLVTDRIGWQAPAVVLTLVVLARAASAHVGDVAAATAAGRISTTLRRRLLDAVRRTPLPDRPSESQLTVLTTRGVTHVEPYVTRYLPALVPAAVLPVATLATIWWLDWLSGLIVLLTLPLVPLFAALVGMATRERADRQWRLMGMLSGHFLDVVTGLPTLVAHRRARAQVATIREVTHRHRRATVDTLKVAFASSTVLELVATLSVALVAVAVGLRLAAGTVDFQVALTVLLLAPEAYWPLRRVGAEYHAAAEGTAALAQADALLAAAPAGDPPHHVPDHLEVRLEDLSLGYPDAPRLVDGLTATLPRRGMVAVTGPSGCGKSTLLATLRGELAPAAGRVVLGGADLAHVDPAWWRAQVAWAPQRPWLVAGSIGDNVRLGRPDATDPEVWHALDRVGLAELVRGLPRGLAAPLGEDGAGLSAGQRARVSLARVVLAGRPVVLLDEPSAHLDAETEAVLLRTLDELARTCLIVTVAHRQAVVDAADAVLPLSPATGLSPADDGGSPVPVEVPSRAPRPPAPEVPDAPSRWGLRTATVLGALSVGSGVALTATAGWLITRASQHPPVLYLLVAIVGVRLFGLARPVLRHAERLVSHDTVLRELAERRAAVYAAMVPLVPGRLGPRRGDLLASVVDDVDAVLDDRLRVRQPLVTSVLVGAGAALFAALRHPGAGLVVLLVAAAGPVAFLVARRTTSVAEAAMVRDRAVLATRVEEVAHGLRDLEQWQATDAALDGVEAVSTRLAHAVRRSVTGTAAGRALAQVAAGLGVVGVALVVPAGAVPGPTLALLLLLPLALADATAPLADAGALSVRTRAAGRRLDDLVALTPRVTDPAAAVPVPERHDLALERVTAAWDDRPALSGLDLAVPEGQHLGVTGPSGSGKSTLAALLMRFLDPVRGEVRLGGTDLRALRLDDVRSRVGLVDDDPHVFASTVLENVRLARPDATDLEVADALARARLGGWVAALPEGVDTFVGAGNREVSGGERARLGLARALLADTRVLVLDEPTAHLDSATAQAVAHDVLDAAGDAGRTVVWITHGTVGLDRLDRVVDLGAQRAEVAAGAWTGEMGSRKMNVLP